MTRKPLQVGVGGLLLAVATLVNGCASEVDDPAQSESVLQVESISPALLVATSVTLTNDIVTVVVSATSRGAGGGSEFNDVIIDNYSVFYDPPLNGTVPELNFATTQIVPAGGSASLSVIAVPAGMKPLIPAVVNATVEVEGRDTLGNQTSASGRFTIFLN
jgi:hypothetical protein